MGKWFSSNKSTIGISISIVVVAFSILLAYEADCTINESTLYIPSQGIVLYCRKNDWSIINQSYSAIWRSNYVWNYCADPAFKEAEGINFGDAIMFGSRHYECSSITTYISIDKFDFLSLLDEQELPNADLYLCFVTPLNEKNRGYYSCIIGAEKN